MEYFQAHATVLLNDHVISFFPFPSGKFLPKCSIIVDAFEDKAGFASRCPASVEYIEAVPVIESCHQISIGIFNRRLRRNGWDGCDRLGRGIGGKWCLGRSG